VRSTRASLAWEQGRPSGFGPADAGKALRPPVSNRLPVAGGDALLAAADLYRPSWARALGLPWKAGVPLTPGRSGGASRHQASAF